ncbi:MAG: GH36-type glycosyl hydrolase domain-containing protein, partial [Candidatus Thorarchaeota archaeon]
GFFDDEKREYVITQPATPLPWINYLGCEDFFGIISNTAGGYTFYQDALLRRLTRYRYNNVPLDFGARYIYIRENSSGDFWSPTWQPIRKKLDKYECRHGLGYTTITSSYHGFEASIRFFIPLQNNLEIWQLNLQNTRDSPYEFSIFSCVEFCLWNAEEDATNFQRNLNIGEVEIDENTIYHKTEFRERRNHFAYFTCSEKPVGYDSQRDVFLGAYRSWERPITVEKGISFNSSTTGWSPIGSHHVKIKLNPGESHTVIYLLGYHENPNDQKFDPPNSQQLNKKFVKKIIKHFMAIENVESAFNDLKKYWEKNLAVFQVKTPDLHTNRMVNIWNPYQCMVTHNLSRSASLFESGISRGIGFRDANQDLLGSVHMVPDRARKRILDLASIQLHNGGTYHQFQPLTKRGNDKVGSNFNDDPLWLILSVSAYIKETGDWTILDEHVVFDNKAGTEQPLLEHLERSLQYIIDRFGPHGLPLIGRADWNDCLNLNSFSTNPDQSFQTTTNLDGKVAESVFIAALFVLAAKEYSEILDYLKLRAKAGTYRQLAEKMETIILEHGWDGKWFLRAYDAKGNKIGSNECEEGKIFIEPQGFCVLANVGLNNGCARSALNAVKRHLATSHGILLFQPAFTRYYINFGEISSYPPGYKENASIFCHTNPWIMIAEAILGNGNQAFDYYTLINPSVREEISEIHRCEPFCYAQMIAGRDSSSFGEAKNSWLTGTAAWNYIAVTNYILGIRPTFSGLMISPVIPDNWASFQAKRVFRGTTYNISVIRKGLGNKVIMKVNGNQIKEKIIPPSLSKTPEIDVMITIM